VSLGDTEALHHLTSAADALIRNLHDYTITTESNYATSNIYAKDVLQITFVSIDFLTSHI